MNETSWIEDPDLARAVAQVDTFVARGGWDTPPMLFALVSTAQLQTAHPELVGAQISESDDMLTAIAQDRLPDPDVHTALAHLAWPDEVIGCVLTQEILVAATPQASPAEARLVVGVLRDVAGGACLLHLRGQEDSPLRGGDLAPNVISALHQTFLP